MNVEERYEIQAQVCLLCSWSFTLEVETSDLELKVKLQKSFVLEVFFDVGCTETETKSTYSFQSSNVLCTVNAFLSGRTIRENEQRKKSNDKLSPNLSKGFLLNSRNLTGWNIKKRALRYPLKKDISIELCFHIFKKCVLHLLSGSHWNKSNWNVISMFSLFNTNFFTQSFTQL